MAETVLRKNVEGLFMNDGGSALVADHEPVGVGRTIAHCRGGKYGVECAVRVVLRDADTYLCRGYLTAQGGIDEGEGESAPCATTGGGEMAGVAQINLNRYTGKIAIDQEVVGAVVSELRQVGAGAYIVGGGVGAETDFFYVYG